MSDFSYKRYCPLSRALDIVGERWTLIIIDTLMLKPCRYGELKADLPGIGSNLLSGRLRKLEAADIVRRRALPHPERGTVYELTEHGQQLRPVLASLQKFGLGLLTLTEPQGRPAAEHQYVMSHAIPEDWDLHEVYEWRIDDAVFHLSVRGQAVEQRPGPAKDPAVVFWAKRSTLERLSAGLLSWTDARRQKLVRTRGDRRAVERMWRVVGEPHRRLGIDGTPHLGGAPLPDESIVP